MSQIKELGILDLLIKQLKNTSNSKLKKVSLNALSTLACNCNSSSKILPLSVTHDTLCKENALVLVSVVPDVVRMLKNDDPEIVMESAKFIKHLARHSTEVSDEQIRKEGGIPLLIDILLTDNHEAVGFSAAALGNISCDNEDCAKEIRDLGAIPLLVDLLRSSHLCVQKAAAAALYNISLFSEDRVTIKNVGGVGILLDLLSSADLETQEQAITTLVNLARNEDIRDEIRIKGGVKLIMEMISNKETPDPVKIGAIRAARCLTFSEANRELIVKLNGLETLLDIISSDYTNDEVVSNAVGVISNLCVYEENRLRVKSKGGIDVIIKLLSSTSEKTQEECASALLNVSFTREIKDEIREKGGIIKLLDLLRHSSFNVVKLASCSALFNLSISDGMCVFVRFDLFQ
eukprot:TRINITY_DN5913_c0_g1_i3.p1 TRINITY_DN5913_c0_g1~~TRINITY_DN5913_c0_g1_i3.p1  ORF type:complete len:461 (+),score=73.56 TRINITY_DN5913_c0_g1_i3:169-1383(+)